MIASETRLHPAVHVYEIFGCVAVGGMARICRAKARGPHGFEKELAVKFVHPELARNPEFLHRFIAEAKLHVALTHGNVVQVVDFGVLDGELYLAMEWVDGPNLDTVLRKCRRRKTPLPVPVAMYVALEILKGLDVIHRRKIVHRDLSPSNILLSRAGEVKIADFGVARVARGERITASGRVMGKWAYMSPEQAHGHGVDRSSDLFSVGVLLFEVFTGQRLFFGRSIQEIVEQIDGLEIPRPSELRRRLPRRLDAIFGRVLDRDPGRRHSSAAELSRDLLEVAYAERLMGSASDLEGVLADLDLPVVGRPGEVTAGRLAGVLEDLLDRREQIAARLRERVAALRELAEHNAELAVSLLKTESGPGR